MCLKAFSEYQRTKAHLLLKGDYVILEWTQSPGININIKTSSHEWHKKMGNIFVNARKSNLWYVLCVCSVSSMHRKAPASLLASSGVLSAVRNWIGSDKLSPGFPRVRRESGLY